MSINDFSDVLAKQSLETLNDAIVVKNLRVPRSLFLAPFSGPTENVISGILNELTESELERFSQLKLGESKFEIIKFDFKRLGRLNFQYNTAFSRPELQSNLEFKLLVIRTELGLTVLYLQPLSRDKGRSSLIDFLNDDPSIEVHTRKLIILRVREFKKKILDLMARPLSSFKPEIRTRRRNDPVVRQYDESRSLDGYATIINSIQWHFEEIVKSVPVDLKTNDQFIKLFAANIDEYVSALDENHPLTHKVRDAIQTKQNELLDSLKKPTR